MAANLEIISAKDFFTKLVPTLFAEGAKKANASGLAGTEFALQFNVVGAGGGNFGLKIKDGNKLEVAEGGFPKANILIELSESDWREAITGMVPGMMDQMMNPNQVGSRDKLDSAKTLNGVFGLELTRAGKPNYKVKMTFNGAESPVANLKMAMDDYFKMVRKEVDGPSLFMSGKMNFEGDMTFLMQLQGFVG